MKETIEWRSVLFYIGVRLQGLRNKSEEPHWVCAGLKKADRVRQTDMYVHDVPFLLYIQRRELLSLREALSSPKIRVMASTCHSVYNKQPLWD